MITNLWTSHKTRGRDILEYLTISSVVSWLSAVRLGFCHFLQLTFVLPLKTLQVSIFYKVRYKSKLFLNCLIFVILWSYAAKSQFIPEVSNTCPVQYYYGREGRKGVKTQKRWEGKGVEEQEGKTVNSYLLLYNSVVRKKSTHVKNSVKSPFMTMKVPWQFRNSYLL